jgi:hypothetical protein
MASFSGAKLNKEITTVIPTCITLIHVLSLLFQAPYLDQRIWQWNETDEEEMIMSMNETSIYNVFSD